MAAGYTHYHFSLDLIDHLKDDHIKDILLKHKTLFLTGNHGPDIFFYHCFYDFPDHISQFGRKMHNEKAAAFFEKAKTIINDDTELSYILGFLCHFILDSQIHPYIKIIMDETNMSHFEIESELDCYLLKKDGLKSTTHHIFSHIQYNESIICTIKSFFPDITYLEIEESLKGMKKADSILTAPSYLKRGILYSLFHLTFHFHQLQGLIINYHHNKLMEPYYEKLESLYNKAIHEALKYTHFFIYEYIDKMPERFYRNYK